MIYEIRHYHFNPKLMDEYKRWATTGAVDYLRSHLDIVGFWVASDVPGETLLGMPDPLGSATVTWIIRWQSMDERGRVLPEVLSTPEWLALFSKVPGGEASYSRAESNFMEML